MNHKYSVPGRVVEEQKDQNGREEGEAGGDPQTHPEDKTVWLSFCEMADTALD